MGVSILFIGYKSGDQPVNDSTTAYVGGQPLKIGASGLEVATDDDGFVGVALNSSANDIANGNGTYAAGVCELQLNDADPQESSDSLPYDDALTYTAGDALYIDTNGLWSNGAPGGGYGDVAAGSKIRARVIEAPVGAVTTMRIQLLGAGECLTCS